MKGAGTDIILGVRHKKLLCHRMYSQTIGYLDVIVCPVSDEAAGDDLPGDRIEYRVRDSPVIGKVAELSAVDIQGIPAQGQAPDGAD